VEDVTNEIAREIRFSPSMLSRQVGGMSGYKKLTPAQARVLAKYSGVRLPHVSNPLIYGFRPSLPKTEHKTLLVLVLGGQMRVMRESGHLPGTHPESVVGAHSFAHYRLLADPSFLSPERHESGGNPRTARPSFLARVLGSTRTREIEAMSYLVILHDETSPWNEELFRIHSRHSSLKAAERAMHSLPARLASRSGIMRYRDLPAHLKGLPGAARHEAGKNPRTARSKKPKAKFASGDLVASVRVTKTPDFAPVASGSLAKIIRSDKETGRYFVMWLKSEKTGWYSDDLFERADAGLGARHERGGNPSTGASKGASAHHPSLMGFRSPPKEIAHGFKMRVVLGAKNAGLSAGKMSHRNVYFGASGGGGRSRGFVGKKGTVYSQSASLYSIPIHHGPDTIGFAQLYLHEGGDVSEQLTTANRQDTLSSLDFGWLASKSAQFRGLGRAGGAVSVKDAALKAKVKALVGKK
jgi:hypothetical protein